MEHTQKLGSYFEAVLQQAASDLHLSQGRYPILRIAGQLTPLSNENKLTEEDMKEFIKLLLNESRQKRFIEDKEVDFAFTYGDDKARFRGNGYYQRGKIGIALRLISDEIKTVEELNLPPVLEAFARKQQGFFLCVGPTGQGKSTTLASIIELINKERLEHIVTIEDPIEYIFKPKKSIIDQREVGTDTKTFKDGLKHVFRQDVDVVMIGEMRDPETMAAAVTAAETGHLVFSTLHTNSAGQTVERIIDSFGADQQDQIRQQLAGSLVGIFSQRLVPRVSGGLIPAYELLIANTAVANLIREGRTHEIPTVIETGTNEGMIDMNRSLATLVQQGEVTVETAYQFATDRRVLEKLL